MVFSLLQSKRVGMIATLSLFLYLSAPASAKPNIVVIMTDDQEDTYSIAAMPKVQSLLVEHGLTFSNSFVNFPLCLPSRVSFLTGQAAHNHGMRANNTAKGGGWLAFKNREANTLPVWLQAAGYKTAMIGKYLNLYGEDQGELERRGTLKAEPQRNKFKQKSAAEFAFDKLRALFNRDNVSAHDGNGGAASRSSDEYPISTNLTEDELVLKTWRPPGWDLWYVFAGTSRYYDYDINENGRLIQFDHHQADYSTDVLRDRSVQFINDHSRGSDPFFMLIAPKAPHGEEGAGKGVSIPAPRHSNSFAGVGLPNDPAFNEEDVSDKSPMIRRTPSFDDTAKGQLANAYRSALQSLQAVDDLVEAIVNALEKSGKLDETIVVFTSDNGFVYGLHRAKGKLNPYEGSIKVPLIMRGPGIPFNQVRHQLVNNLDLVATIEELAGLAEPGLVPDGRSLVPLFADAAAPWRDAILVEGGRGPGNSAKAFIVVRAGNRKYVRYGDGFEELYDLTADPHELENKASDPAYADDLSALRITLDHLKSCAGESCFAAQ